MQKSLHLQELKAAFPFTIPVFAGFYFTSFAYGILMNSSGFSFYYPMFMSLIIYGGSLEFITITMLLSAFAPLETFIVAFMIQARHLFYGISMLEKYRNLGKKRFYMIFGLCDETFSINYSTNIPEKLDKGWFMFYVTLLNHFYWVSGATIGGLLGSILTNGLGFNLEGLDFVMTALFVVILIDQCINNKRNIPSTALGLIASVFCLLVFGPDAFLLPSMASILVLLLCFKKPFFKMYKKDLME